MSAVASPVDASAGGLDRYWIASTCCLRPEQAALFLGRCYNRLLHAQRLVWATGDAVAYDEADALFDLCESFATQLPSGEERTDWTGSLRGAQDRWRESTESEWQGEERAGYLRELRWAVTEGGSLPADAIRAIEPPQPLSTLLELMSWLDDVFAKVSGELREHVRLAERIDELIRPRDIRERLDLVLDVPAADETIAEPLVPAAFSEERTVSPRRGELPIVRVQVHEFEGRAERGPLAAIERDWRRLRLPAGPFSESLSQLSAATAVAELERGFGFPEPTAQAAPAEVPVESLYLGLVLEGRILRRMPEGTTVRLSKQRARLIEQLLLAKGPVPFDDLYEPVWDAVRRELEPEPGAVRTAVARLSERISVLGLVAGTSDEWFWVRPSEEETTTD